MTTTADRTATYATATIIRLRARGWADAEIRREFQTLQPARARRFAAIQREELPEQAPLSFTAVAREIHRQLRVANT